MLHSWHIVQPQCTLTSSLPGNSSLFPPKENHHKCPLSLSQSLYQGLPPFFISQTHHVCTQCALLFVIVYTRSLGSFWINMRLMFIFLPYNPYTAYGPGCYDLGKSCKLQQRKCCHRRKSPCVRIAGDDRGMESDFIAWPWPAEIRLCSACEGGIHW